MTIVDRSRLAHNIYAMILRPLGYSLFPFKTLREMKENLPRPKNMQLVVVNSNTFGHHFANHFDWFYHNKDLTSIPKIFLCDPKEKDYVQNLKKIPNSEIIWKPFYPPDLKKKIAEVLESS